MKKVNVDSLIGTVVALVVATFIGFAGSQGGVTYQGFPLFALCAALASWCNGWYLSLQCFRKLSITLI